MRTGEIRFLLLGSALCLLAACAAPKDASQAAALKVWPAPPDPPRYVYEAQLRDSKSIRVDSEDERMRRAIIGTDDASRSFGKAFGVAARGGRIYVSDTEKRVVHAFDVPRRRFSTRDEAALASDGGDPAHPYLVAARLEIAREHEARAQIRSLYRALRRTPVRLPSLDPGDDADRNVARLARAIAAEVGLPA